MKLNMEDEFLPKDNKIDNSELESTEFNSNKTEEEKPKYKTKEPKEKGPYTVYKLDTPYQEYSKKEIALKMAKKHEGYVKDANGLKIQ